MPMSYCDPFPAVHGSVLVLENDVDLGPLLRDVLTMAGYDVFLAESSSEALAQLSSTSMAAAVVEWSAPDGNGELVADTCSRTVSPTWLHPAPSASTCCQPATFGRPFCLSLIRSPT